MALEQCPSCRKKISQEATVCPKCGQPLDADWLEKAAEKSRKTKRGCLMVILVAAVAVVALAQLDTPSTRIVTNASEYGDQWGFTVSYMTVICLNRRYSNGIVRPHVLVIANGNTYALNGAAMGSGLYLNARKIMKKDRQGLFTFSGPKNVLQRGLRFCKK